MTDSYRTIAGRSEGLYKEKGSKFIALAWPVSDPAEVKPILEELRKEYYDARHHCYAWRIGPDGNQTRTMDDGEPSQTAGRPILGQLLSNELTNTLIVVIRYFGGTKLGVPGLIRAYKEAAADALANAAVIEKTVDTHFRITFGYTEMNGVMGIVKELAPQIVSQAFDNLSTMELAIRRRDAGALRGKLEKVEGLTLEELGSW